MIRSQVDMGRVTVVLYLRADLGRAGNSEKRVLTEVIIQTIRWLLCKLYFVCSIGKMRLLREKRSRD